MKTNKIVLFCAFLSLFVTNVVFGQTYLGENRLGQNEFKNVEGRRVGPVTLKSGISTEGTYESNVYWTSNNKKHDLINVTTPVFLVDLPLGIDERHLVQAMYKADIGSFSNYKDQNYVNQEAIVNGDFKLPFGYLNVQDDFNRTSDRAATEFTSRVKRIENKASTALGIERNKVAFETGFSNQVKNYENRSFDAFDYQENMISETAYYQLFPKTKVLVEYDHGFIDYSKDGTRDGDYDQYMFGFKGDITGKTKGLLKGGYQHRTYDTAGRSGFEGFVAEAGLITQFSDRTKVTLKYVKNAVESTYVNNNYYDMNYFSADLEQKLASRLSLLLSSGVSRNIYPEVNRTLSQKRQDTILNEAVGFKYTIKDWALAKLGYQYKEDISSINAQSYVDNLWTLGFDFKI